MKANPKMLNPRPFRVRAVVFDFDGTLTVPGALDFSAVKRCIDCPPEQPVLEHIRQLADPKTRARAYAELNRFELQAARHALPNVGAQELIASIKRRRLPMAILSRNSIASIEAALQRFDRFGLSDFDVVITRDDPIAPKPDPAGVLAIADRIGIQAGDIVTVGDFIFDMQAGRQAGAVTVYLKQGTGEDPDPSTCDYLVSRLKEVEAIIDHGMPLSQGKLPNAFLKAFIDPLTLADASLLIKPGIGEDTAAADIGRDEVLVLKSDPITFATDSLGQYSVLVNANDIATSGAVPRWFLTTLLFPRESTPSQICCVMNDLRKVSEKYAITLCGGHTEITDAVNRPVVIGSMAGTVSKSRLIKKSRMQSGDQLLMTKSIAVEGTAILAQEFEQQLRTAGTPVEEINACKSLIEHIGILQEARIAADMEGVSAMHDVTEGGLATAVQELSIAGGHGIHIAMDRIAYYPQTLRLCDYFGLSPLGLIGSGTLLICCRPDQAMKIVRRIQSADITVSIIGEVLARDEGVSAMQSGRTVDWPQFEVDELARLFNTHE